MDMETADVEVAGTWWFGRQRMVRIVRAGMRGGWGPVGGFVQFRGLPGVEFGDGGR